MTENVNRTMAEKVIDRFMRKAELKNKKNDELHLDF